MYLDCQYSHDRASKKNAVGVVHGFWPYPVYLWGDIDIAL